MSLTGGFNDVHQILGGKPLKSATDDFESLTNTTGGGATQIDLTQGPHLARFLLKKFADWPFPKTGEP